MAQDLWDSAQELWDLTPEVLWEPLAGVRGRGALLCPCRAVQGLLGAVGARGARRARATRVAGGGWRCVPATAWRAGGTGGLGRAMSWPGTSAAIRGRRAVPAGRALDGQAGAAGERARATAAPADGARPKREESPRSVTPAPVPASWAAVS